MRALGERSEVERLVAAGVALVGEVGRQAGRDSGVDPGLLGSYLDDLLANARTAARLSSATLDVYRDQGEAAAVGGTGLAALLDLYLSATWRLWDEIGSRVERSSPASVAVVAAALFRAADDAAEAIAEGYERAQRRTVRLEESLRREFVDDLLAGTASPETLRDRAARFGFNLAGTHHVVVARTNRPLVDAGPVQSRIAAHVARSTGAGMGVSDAIVSTKDGLLVCIFPGDGTVLADDLARVLKTEDEGSWELGVGRPGRGPGAVVGSFHEARQSLDLEARLGRGTAVARFEDLLPYRVLVADQGLLAEMVDAVLGPLEAARGGGQPLIDTIEAYIAASGNTSACARALHLTARAVTYRIERVEELTGYSLSTPEDRFVLEIAIRARPLNDTSHPNRSSRADESPTRPV